jgi:hypothetical protein
MFNRYTKTSKIINNSEIYEDVFKNKNIKNILQYSTFDFKNLKNLITSEKEFIVHTVQPFDKLYMISHKYYGSPEYGWLILFSNNLSDETKLKINQTLRIYIPLNEILELF